jgi:hypothetical protein
MKSRSIFSAALIAALLAAETSAGTSVRMGLRASNGQWVCAELTGSRAVVANRNDMGPWETFNLIDLNGGHLMSGDRLAIQSADSRFFCAESGGGSTVVANRLSPYAWEEFRLVRAAGPGAVTAGDTVFVQTDHGQYLRAVNGGGGIVDGQGYGQGAWEAFTVSFAESPEQTNSAMIDVNGDGILDEVVRPGNHKFKSYIANWYTECYDYSWYPVNSYFYLWGYDFGDPFGDSPGFSNLWAPSLFWVYESSYSYCYTYVEPTIEFEADFGSTYQLYRDSSGSTSYNPGSWQQIFSSAGLWAGIHTFSLGLIDADSAHLDQYFLVKLGKQPNPPGGLNAALFHNGSMDLAEFSLHAIQILDPPAVDPEVINNPATDDALEEVIEQILRESQNREPNPRTDPNLLARRVIVIAIVLEILDQWPVSYCVYRKLDAAGDKAYVGRTAGPGIAEDVVRRRDQKPDRADMNAAGYKDATYHSFITMYGLSRFGYCAMRGREQIVMDNVEFVHGRKSPFNYYRGVKASNRMRECYYRTSNVVWPSLWFLTGDAPGAHWNDVRIVCPPDKRYYVKDTVQLSATTW